MRKTIVAMLLLGASIAPVNAVSRPMPIPHGPPNIPNTFVCKVLPEYGGGTCTTNPYPHLGASCSCEGNRGRRPGVVSTR